MIRIRPYKDSDRAALIGLMIECETFHQTPVPTKADLDRSLSGLPPGVEFIVADDNGPLAGFISFSTLYPATNAHSQFFLQELFVSESYRKKNIGKKLMSALVDLAIDRGCARIEWITARKNQIAQNFYESIGAKIAPKLVYRFEGDDLVVAAKKLGAF